MDRAVPTIDCDDPEAIARGQRCLAWSAAVTGLFVVAATFTLHVAQERHERDLMKNNRAAYAASFGTDLARHFPSPY